MDKTIQKALRKAKWKQLFKISLISMIAGFILLISFYKVGNHFAAKSTARLHEALFLHNAVAEPNVQINSQVTSNRSMFGGNIITNRSKNVNGYLVPWSTLTSSYGWIGIEIDHNELIPGFRSAGENSYEYDKQTKQKVATFYHPSIKKYYDGVQNELAEISQLENYVTEVAISFKKPLTIDEISELIPEDSFNIDWLYMTSAIGDESKGPLGMPVYGFSPGKFNKNMFDDFIETLRQYDKNNSIEEIQEFIIENDGENFRDVKILGVMLSGRSESFGQLVDAPFIRGASVGVTAPIVPYIQPTK